MKAKKLPSGSWRVRVCIGVGDDGKYHYKSLTAETKKEAERLAGLYEYTEPVKDTLDAALVQHIETSRIMGASPQTIAGYESIRNNLSQRLRNTPISSLTTADVQAEVNRIAPSLTPKTVRNRVGLITAALKQYDHAVRFDRLMIPKARNHEVVIPTDAELLALLEDAHTYDEPLYLAILLGALCGLRRSEMCALVWSDVDLKKKTLRISRAIVKDEHGVYHTKDPKTEAGYRSVPIPEIVAKALQEQLGLPNQTILGVTPDGITRRFERACDRTGVKSHMHALRHYYASSLIAVGAPDKYIQSSIGHASMDMVRRVYGHVMSSKKHEIFEGLETRNKALFSKL